MRTGCEGAPETLLGSGSIKAVVFVEGHSGLVAVSTWKGGFCEFHFHPVQTKCQTLAAVVAMQISPCQPRLDYCIKARGLLIE